MQNNPTFDGKIEKQQKLANLNGCISSIVHEDVHTGRCKITHLLYMRHAPPPAQKPAPSTWHRLHQKDRNPRPGHTCVHIKNAMEG
jgi:hypothetical protein